MLERTPDDYDVVVIGAGPAGLSAALNLVRARRRVLVLDGNRPRHSATLISHGFLTRDNTPPHELRRLGREEYLSYPEAEHQLARVTSIRALAEPGEPVFSSETHTTGSTGLFEVTAAGINGAPDRTVRTATVLLATGLREELPALPSIRSFYGMGLFSCVACDGYEYSDRPIALIGETSDVAWRALLIAQWSDNLTVFTNGADAITPGQEEMLVERGVRVERRPIADVEGGREGVTGVRLEDGEVVPVSGGFVRPRWHAQLEFAASLGLDSDAWGLLLVDRAGRTSHAGIYAAGDITSPGPQQLIVAAGSGARVAATINRDLIGIPTAHGR
ncbi:NAD(P)/FAD-dependent oxidoreductase [Salinibacterium sp. SYSU T00001]|uniref:NAD(P)/FAD-dependent oxidoreductase n=1 Tax=Homoserinimonas sedimenticola TaxID=2986805 RepID=UPI002235C9C0|nr:NAD(P)/FAD-dependent oxidoreductase [Salinibacterium sedimenticola]MCW4384935.1 NAD(P)/FAD-dependent oxidoreductase [Salinibacterium sedimenticola]